MKRSPVTLFEVSWEVANRVGGIHTAVATKARALAARMGDAHVAVGPWLLSAGDANAVLESDPAYDGFADACRAAGVPVRVGRWRIPGRPRTVLVDFSALLSRKDELLRALWDRYRVDSLFGGWDYVEPVLFGHAAGLVVELWWRHYVAGTSRTAVAQFHEWTSGAGLLHLHEHAPWIGTVLTLHSTVLGSALSAAGERVATELAERTPDEIAEALRVQAPHTLVNAAVRYADELTTVSSITAAETERFHGRAPDATTPNGIDPATLAKAGGDATRAELRARVVAALSRVLGEDVSGAALVVTGARYEFHNKGFDLLLDAAADVAARPGRALLLVLSVPAGNSGVRRDVAERLAAPRLRAVAEPGIATHELFAPERDAIARRCRERGLDNAPGSRVRVVHVPAYLDGDDGVLGLRYLELVRAADLACFPSIYESWGYTPQESLALGVPTATTDCAGFALWAAEEGVGAADGLHVLHRAGRTHDETRAELAALLEQVAAAPPGPPAAACSGEPRCGATWEDLLERHEKAWRAAARKARTRARKAGPALPRRRVPLPARTDVDPALPRLFGLRVTPRLPPEIEALRELAWNWRFTWHPRTRALFEELDPATWAACRGNPVRLLRDAPQAALDARAADAAYVARVAAGVRDLRGYLDASDSGPRTEPVAYFCAEFGIDASLPIYSGGLGVLAGDHLRAASDLGVPLVAVGILYRRGYFRQRLLGGVEQTETPDPLDPAEHALTLVRDEQGAPLEVELRLPGAALRLRAWRAHCGRVPLYLLDADVPANRPEDRAITAALYGGGAEDRLRQELVLGRGGVLLLDALGIRPAVCHVNEGHGAFVPLERTALLRARDGLTFDEAREYVRATTVFTTHTPVPAGHDRFDEELVRRHFSDAPERLGIPWERFYELGSAPGDNGRFNMTTLALSFGGFVNGVSRCHATVSRELVAGLHPHVLPSDAPIHAITNGVHLGAWTAPEIAALVGAHDRTVTGEDFRSRAAQLDDDALWSVRRDLRARLVARVRAAAPSGLSRRDLELLDDDALLIGFARRFATYKRAGLLFRDPERLAALLGDPERPVRILIAGKAHPRDAAAKELIAGIGRLAREPRFAGRVLLLEGYDMQLARSLVQGVDVWLNTPRAPQEASGTSGMKAALNGALNLSVADGWWPEAADGTNGWTIGAALEGGDDTAQDTADAGALYALLEDEVVPAFFGRDDAGRPRAWLDRVRRSLATVPHVFDAVRMVAEYRDQAYVPLALRGIALAADGHAAVRAATREDARLAAGMRGVRIVSASVGGADRAHPGDMLGVRVDVHPGDLALEDLVVELVVRRGGADAGARADVVALERDGAAADGATRYEGRYAAQQVGAFDYGVRVRPRRDGESAPRLDDRLVWG